MFKMLTRLFRKAPATAAPAVGAAPEWTDWDEALYRVAVMEATRNPRS